MRRNIQCTHVATGYCCLHSQSQNKELKKKKNEDSFILWSIIFI